MSASVASAMLDEALRLAALGIPVIPTWPLDAHNGCTCPLGGKCRQAGKHPWPKHGANDATTSPAGIRSWYAFRPDSGVAINLELAGLVDVAPDSREWLAEFQRRGLPATAAFASGGGEGHEHHLYRRPAGCPIMRRCVSGQYDVMSAGLAVVAGRHASGRAREWIRPLVSLDALPEAPAWVVEELQRGADRQVRRAVDGDDDEDDDGPPVRLDDDGMARWRGDLVELKPDGALDRSQSLWALGAALRGAGATERTIVAALEERDQALGWGKYAGRKDAAERYQETARRVVEFVRAGEREPRLVERTAEPQNVDAELLAEVERLRAENAQLRQHNSRVAEVLRNPSLSATVKIAGVVALFEIAGGVSREGDAPRPLYREAVAEKAGISADTAGKALDVLSAPGGVFTKVVGYERVQTIDRETGEVFDRPRKVARFQLRAPDLGESLKALATYTPADRPAHGGKREPRCPDHPEAGTKNRQVVVCAATGCGRVLDGESPGKAQALYQQDAANKYPTVLETGGGEPLYTQVAAIGATGRNGHALPPSGRYKRCWRCLVGLKQSEYARGLCDGCDEEGRHEVGVAAVAGYVNGTGRTA